MIFFVSGKPDLLKWKQHLPLSDPLCVFKVLRTLPHFEDSRYCFKLNGEWLAFAQLDASGLTEHHLRNVEAFKFVPTNEIIWNRADRVLSFLPF